MPGEGEGTGEGTGQGTGAGTGQQVTPPTWTAQLPTDLKANEVFTKYPTLGDLGKSHIEVLGKIKELDGMTAKVGDLEGKLKGAVIKPPENATKEQVEAYLTSLGRPMKPEEYDFPKGSSDIEHDPIMVKWAQQLFFDCGLTKDQAAKIGASWDVFIKGIAESERDLDKKMEEEADKNFRAMFKTDEDHAAHLELAKRFWKKVAGTELNDFIKETGIFAHPTLMKFIIEVAKKTGEDVTPPSSKGGGGQTGPLTPDMLYDKTNFPKQQGKY